MSTKENSSTLPQEVWQGICDDLLEHNLHLTLFRMPDDELLDPNRMPKILREWMADGMIVDYTHDVPQGLYDVIESSALPAVYVNTDREFDCVKPDDFDAGYRATKLLVDMGHCQVLYADFHNIMVEGKTHYSAWERLAGYKRAMIDSHLDPSVIDGGGEGPRKAIAETLNGGAPPTAVVCYGDLDAEYFVLAAAYAGLLIPRDLSIVTFGAKSCRFGGSEYSHFTIPEYEMGRRACAILRSKIASGMEQHTVESLPFGFVTGETVAVVQKKVK
ncbi:MAG TPA: substrate-binding domain-containing protein [Capsulimonadaceae bacterium]